MLEVIDHISEIEEKILNEIKQSSSNKNISTRILSERKLAELYSIPRTRVREALKRLIKKNYLYKKPGSGTYLNYNYDKTKKIPTKRNLFAFPNMGGIEAVRLNIKGLPDDDGWKYVIDLFMAKFPFIEVITEVEDKEAEKTAYDVVFLKTFELYQGYEEFSEVNTGQFKKQGFNENQLCPGILKSCEVNGKLLGMPILRTTACLYANKKLMKAYGITEEEIKDCYDIFKFGGLVEKQSDGEIMGARYLGFIFHAALEGLDMSYEKGLIGFDEDKVKSLLKNLKPYIKKRHIVNPDSQLSALLADQCLFYPDFLAIYPDLKEHKANLVPLHLPCKPDGFFCEWMYLGAIPMASKNKEEANLLLSFLTSAEAQRILIEKAPFWLSVRNDILEGQRKYLPLPAARVQFDIRSYYSQMNAVLWKAGPLINMELAKYFMDIVDLDEALARIKSCCNHVEPRI